MSTPNRSPLTSLTGTLAARALCVLAAGLAPACSAQQPAADTTEAGDIDAMAYGEREASTPEERAERQTAYLTERLSLSEEQIPQVRAIALDYAERTGGLRADGGDRRARMQAARAMQAEQKAELLAVLDDEQDEELEAVYDELRERMRQRMRERRARG